MSWNTGLNPEAPARREHAAFRLFLTIGWLLVIGTAFGLGYLLAQHDATEAQMRISMLQKQRDALSEGLAEAREERVRLERSHLMDQQARRAVLEQLKELQQERLELARQVSYLEHLVQEGGSGVIQVKDLELALDGEPGHYHYRFTVSQLVPDFGESVGKVFVKLAVRDEDGTRMVAVKELDPDAVDEFDMRFEYFQQFEGAFVLPRDVIPESLIVEIKPTTEKLVPSTESFPWRLESDSEAPPLPMSGTDTTVLD